ncbi:MAG TPA: sigma-54 dependent transcriptional regulator [Bacteroidota bacterium]|nr:sigma-54 dependent transcriptional regulator [Bacteroidota bacterium]
MPRILIVDDEKSIRESIRMILDAEGYASVFAENGQEGIDAFRTGGIDAVLLDIKMPPGKDGLEVLGEMHRLDPAVPVVMISGHGTFDTAVEATRMGAFDYLPKPLDRDKMLVVVRNAVESVRLRSELEGLRPRYRILGDSPKLRDVLAVVRQVATTDTRILITGESGTGKELIAREIHRLSKRSGGPFVEVNCAAIPAELIESELFGHEKGSFTGATALRIGKFEQADTGTVFLDEIGDMSPQAQAKVLRALEEYNIERVGGSKQIPVDVRVVAATNKDLPAAITGGRFREDLYHRLNVIPIHIPPLRERREDVPVLVAAFITEICEKNGFAQKAVAPGVVAELAGMNWSGNVRELRNYVERLVILTPGREILSVGSGPPPPSAAAGMEDMVAGSETLQEFKDRSEAAFIAHQLEKHGWNVSRTAEALGMERSHLYTKIKKFGLERKKEDS